VTDPWQDPGASRRHLEALAARGIGLRRIARATGLTPSYVQRIRNGHVHRIRTSTATAILAVREPVTKDTPRPATRTRALLRWFHAEGFTLVQLAARVGLHPDTLARLRPTVRLDTELRLSAFQRSLAD
jgi:AraC-like DNA-binding protein